MSRSRETEVLPSPEVEKSIHRVLILNRGEIALRILKVCQSLNIGAVVGFSKADASSLAVREALKMQQTDARFGVAYLGDSPAHLSYANFKGAVDSAIAYGCNAIHPGYGFTAEDPKAAQAFIDEGIRWIGPSPDAMRKLGDKANARRLAKELRIPIIRGTDVLKDEKQALSRARRLKFPVMLKASNAGGGHGIRRIHNEEELHKEFPNLSEQYQEVYLEKDIPGKHIEIQIAADQHGNVVFLGDRECSAQREFQKVLEESPSSAPKNKVQSMEEDAIRFVRATGYENLVTIEFMYDPNRGRYYFLEANTRIQVEHPVTEMRIGQNLIEMQFRISQGEPIPAIEFKNNHVIEVRHYAEKPQQGFEQVAGTLHNLAIPQGEGIRFDSGYEEGDTIAKDYDRTLAKTIVEGQTKEEATQRLAIALHEFDTNVPNNKEFLLWLISQPEFVRSSLTTTFIEEAWPAYQRLRVREVVPFLEEGEFQEQPIPRRLDTTKLPQNMINERDGRQRNYFQEVEEFQNRYPEGCAFRFGIYEEAGIRLALGFWDYSRHGGTLGAEEGNAVAALLELASKEKLPVVMFTNSGGARQQEDTLALQQMDFMVAAKRWFRVPMMYNIFCGGAGGVHVSIAQRANTQYMLADTTSGFTGMNILANILGQKPNEMKSTVQSTTDHFWNRNIDLIVQTPREALERILYEQSILELGSAVKTKGLFIPPPRFRTFDSDVPLFTAPSHYRYQAIIAEIGHFGHKMLDRLKHRREIPTQLKELTNAEREALVMDPYRPTAAEFLLPEMGTFDAISPFSNMSLVEGQTYQYPPIIGAYARLSNRRYLVLGQQPQRRNEYGVETKVYKAPGPEDFEWAKKKVRESDHDDLVDEILLFADTTGGDASEKAEAGGIMAGISDFIDVVHEIGKPATSVLLGVNGSGGGITFARPLNRAAEFSNALSTVAAVRVMHYITTLQWPTEQQRIALLNSLKDSRPEVRLSMHFIDEVLQEPPGGIQTDPLLGGRLLKGFLTRTSIIYGGKTEAQIRRERYERSRNAAQFATVLLRK